MDGKAENPTPCASTVEGIFNSRLLFFRNQRGDILAKLADVYESDEFAGMGFEDRARMEDRDEIAGLKFNLWETRRRFLVLIGAANLIPSDYSGAVEYFERIKGDAIRKLAIGCPIGSTRKDIMEFLAAGIACHESGMMLEALKAHNQQATKAAQRINQK